MELLRQDEIRTSFPGSSVSRTYMFPPMKLFGQISVSLFKSKARDGVSIGGKAEFAKVNAQGNLTQVSSFSRRGVTKVDCFASVLADSNHDPELRAVVSFFVLPDDTIYLDKGALSIYKGP